MAARRGLKIGLGVLLVLVVAVAAAIWWFFIRDDSPPEARLVDRPASTQPGTAGDDADQSADGDWTVLTGEETFAGFRIQEQFPGFDNTAVVRTPAVEGSMTVDGTEITDVLITADLTALESEDAQPPGVPGLSNRVEQLRDDGLETDRFPTATFALTEPIRLPTEPAPGQELSVDAVGELTLHGETRPVTIPVRARWSGDVIDVAGSVEVALADHGMDPPNRPFVTVADTGTLEVQLTFTRSGS